MKLVIRRKAVFRPVNEESVAPSAPADDKEALKQAQEYYKEKRLDEKTPENPEERPLMVLLPDGTIKGNPDGKWELAGKLPFEGSRG